MNQSKPSKKMLDMLGMLRMAGSWVRWPRGHVTTMDALMRRGLIAWRPETGYVMTNAGHDALRAAAK